MARALACSSRVLVLIIGVVAHATCTCQKKKSRLVGRFKTQGRTLLRQDDAAGMPPTVVCPESGRVWVSCHTRALKVTVPDSVTQARVLMGLDVNCS